MTGTPESICSRMSACDTESQMYSKCIVDPLMSTPMAITASNGWLGMGAVIGAGVPERELTPPFEIAGENVKPPRRSVAVAPASTFPALITLGQA